VSDGERLGYGCLGGVLAYLVVFALPEMRAIGKARKAAREAGTPLPRPEPFDYLLWFAIAVAYVAVGGAGALWGHALPTLDKPNEPAYAVVYGFTAEAVWGGLVRGFTE
jgi:hypothetical protein